MKDDQEGPTTVINIKIVILNRNKQEKNRNVLEGDDAAAFEGNVSRSDLVRYESAYSPRQQRSREPMDDKNIKYLLL